MQSSSIPTKIPLPFANSAGSSYKNTIPTASQIGITNGKASLTDGFPPLTFQPISSGGIPPFGADFNGILYEITSIQQWQEAGGMFPYDSTFSTAIGGYPKGAVLQAAAFGGLWVNTTENNTTNPDTGGAGWTSLAFEGSQSISVTSADVTLTQLQSAYPVLIISGALTAARNLIFPAIVGEWIVQNNTTGAYTLTAKTASGTGVTLTQGQSTYVYGDGTNIVFADSAKVASFNGRVGTVSLTSSDVTTALGFTPYNATNPAGYLSSAVTTFNTRSGAVTLTSGDVTGALGYTPYNSSNPSGYLSSAVTTFNTRSGAVTLTSGDVTGALGFTPYNSTNPSGYLSSAVTTFNTRSGAVTLTSGDVTGALGFTPYNSSNPSSYTPLSQFNSSNAANGYQKLPSGIIIQWGIVSVTPSGSAPSGSFNFNSSFPNGCFHVSGCALTKIDGGSLSTAGVVPIVLYYNYNSTGSSWRMDSNVNAGFSGTVQFNYIAIGY